MRKIFLAIIVSAIFLSSCASFNNLKYGSILSLDELNGIYVDTIGQHQMDNRVSYGIKYIMEKDTADVYRYQFINNKYLKVSTLTERGFEERRAYKGRYNKKENYLEISIQKKILPLIILNSYLNERKLIGKDENNNLLIDYRYESFGMLMPLGASGYNYQTTSTLVKLENVEYIPTKLGTKFGYTNLQGDILIDPKYDFARLFSSNVARVKVNNKWGLIDKKGNYIFEPQFDYISNMHKDSTAYVMNDSCMGLIDKSGNEILSIKELKTTGFEKLDPNVYKIYKNKKWGIYNSMKKEYIVEPIYDNINIQYSKRDKEWLNHKIEPYVVLSSANEEAILVSDTLVVPLTHKMRVEDIYILDLQLHTSEYEKVSDKIHALNIDFSKTSITREDIYPFYIKIRNKLYLIDHKNNYYELLSENETIKMAFLGGYPRKYIENNPLTYEQITNLFK